MLKSLGRYIFIPNLSASLSSDQQNALNNLQLDAQRKADNRICNHITQPLFWEWTPFYFHVLQILNQFPFISGVSVTKKKL